MTRRTPHDETLPQVSGEIYQEHLHTYYSCNYAISCLCGSSVQSINSWSGASINVATERRCEKKQCVLRDFDRDVTAEAGSDWV